MVQPKFRGKSKETNEWSYGFGWYETDYTDEYLKELGQTLQDAVLYTDGGPIMCRIDSMGRYTGIMDNNAKEIYEGDLCSYSSMLVENQPTFKGEVEWDKYRFAIRNLEPHSLHATPMIDLNLFGVSAVVIGNVHENPEPL